MNQKLTTKTVTGTEGIGLLLLLALMTGCSHTIKRYGYELSETQDVPADCDPQFYREMPLDTGRYQVVGAIKLGDSGFSIKCDEDDAVAILKKDACAVGADLVNITDEDRVDFWSTCYRAKASFLKQKTTPTASASTTDVEVIGEIDEADYRISTEESDVGDRVARDQKRKRMLRLLGVGIGATLGLLIVGPVM